MTTLLTTETERELATALAGELDLPDSSLEEVGAWMTEQALTAIYAASFVNHRAYQQSVGAGVIVQSATPEELSVWDAAIEAARPEAIKMLKQIATELVEQA